MPTTNNFQASSFKAYLAIVSLVVGVVLLVFYFKVLPQLLEVVEGLPQSQAKPINTFLPYLIVICFAVIVLLNLVFWKLEGKLRQEEKKLKPALDVNPNDSLTQEKLREIEEKRQHYMSIVHPIIVLVLGVIVAIVAITAMKPLFQHSLEGLSP